MATKNENLTEASSVEVRSPDVPILSSEDVQALMKELSALRAENAEKSRALENQFTIPRGQAMPEPADDYVTAEDTDVRLDRYNDPQVTQEAIRSGKLNYARSRISHKNYAPGMGSMYGGLATEAHADVAASTYWMYDDGGWARRVPRQSISSSLQSGLHPTCPLCNGRHKDSETNPNVCPKRKKVKYTICQICQASGVLRYIWDTQDQLMLDEDGRPIGIPGAQPTDPALMVSMDLPSSPEARLQVRLEQHIRVYHPATAATLKLHPVTESTL